MKMTLKEQVNQDIKTAMKAKDQVTLRGIRAIKAGIMLLETDGSGNAVGPNEEIKLVQKLIKQRQDSLGIFETQNREDLAVKEREEIEVLSQYLPTQLDEAALTTIVNEVIAKVNAEGMKDMGKVMGMVSAQVAGQADGKMISGIVKNRLMGK